MKRIGSFFRIEIGKLNNPGFIPEQRRYGHFRFFMAFSLYDGVGGMVVVVAPPFEMREKPCMVFPEILNCIPAIFCRVTGYNYILAHKDRVM